MRQHFERLRPDSNLHRFCQRMLTCARRNHGLLSGTLSIIFGRPELYPLSILPPHHLSYGIGMGGLSDFGTSLLHRIFRSIQCLGFVVLYYEEVRPPAVQFNHGLVSNLESWRGSVTGRCDTAGNSTALTLCKTNLPPNDIDLSSVQHPRDPPITTLHSRSHQRLRYSNRRRSRRCQLLTASSPRISPLFTTRSGAAVSWSQRVLRRILIRQTYSAEPFIYPGLPG